MLLLQIRAAGSLNDRRYDAAIADFRKAYPNDSCLDFLLVDSCRLRNQMAGALEAVNNIDRSYGPDPYLNILRGAFLMKDGRCDDALKAAREATENERDLNQGYWIQVEALLAQKNYGEATWVLRVLKDERQQSIAPVRAISGFRELAKSPAYLGWTKEKHSP